MKKYIPLCLAVAVGVLSASFALAAPTLGSLQETANVGNTVSIGLNTSSTGAWYVYSNSDSSVASTELDQANLLLTALTPGSTTVLICTDTAGTDCMQVTLTVSAAPQVLGATTVASHPAGSWVLQGKTVYYVTSTGLVPITTWAIFLSNGGEQSKIQAINLGDLTLPLQSFMTARDPRVAQQ